MDRHLWEIQQSLQETHSTVLSHNVAVNRILDVISRAPTYVPSLHSDVGKKYFTQPSVCGYGIEIKANPTVSPIPQESVEERDTDHGRESIRISCSALLTRSEGLRGMAQPASSFELSQHFFPETYSDFQRLPQSSFMVFEVYEYDSSGNYRTNCYQALYLSSPRRWCRISIFIRMHRSSRYWTFTQIAKDGYNPPEDAVISSAPLLYSLQLKLQRKLQMQECHEKVELQLALTSNEALQNQ